MLWSVKAAKQFPLAAAERERQIRLRESARKAGSRSTRAELKAAGRGHCANECRWVPVGAIAKRIVRQAAAREGERERGDTK